MSIKTFFTIISVIGIVFGLGYLLAPAQIAPVFGWNVTPDVLLAQRFLGAHLLAWALIGWFARDDHDAPLLRGVLIAGAVGFPAGLVVTVVGIRSGVINALSWPIAAAYLFGAGGSAYFLTSRLQKH